MNVDNGDFKCLQTKLGNLGVILFLILAISSNLLYTFPHPLGYPILK